MLTVKVIENTGVITLASNDERLVGVEEFINTSSGLLIIEEPITIICSRFVNDGCIWFVLSKKVMPKLNIQASKVNHCKWDDYSMCAKRI